MRTVKQVGYVLVNPSARSFPELDEPTEMGDVTTAVFDDTCGNLIQIVQLA